MCLNKGAATNRGMNRKEKNLMSMLRLVATLVLAAVISDTATARERVSAKREQRIIDQGCPAGSYSIVTSPDGSSLTVLFDRFAVEGNEANGGFARVSCSMDIPLNLPAGYSLGVYAVDFRGYARLEQKQRAELQVEYGTASRSKARRFNRDLRGTYDGDYVFSERLKGGFMKRMGCGSEAVLSFSASLTLVSRRGAPTGQMVLDSVDGRPGGGLVFGLDLRKCNGR
jgi:hypothetical protein